MKSSINKKILLYRVQTRKDPEAFTKLYDLYVKKIYRFVYFKVSSHEEAEDITSEVFLSSWNYISEGNKIDSFSGLLYRVARNKVIDLYRKKSKQQAENIEDVELADKRDLADDTANKTEIDKIIKTIHKLKQEYQEVITLSYIDELTTAEIAEITNKGKVAVRVTLHRALKKLRELMGE